MTYHRPRWFPGATLVLAVTLAGPAALVHMTATAQDDNGACDRGWYDVELREDIAPEGALARGPDEVWVAGGSALGGGRRQASVLHGTDGDWQLETPPPPDERDSGLMAIASAGPDEPIWAVGFGRETDYVTAYVARRDGGGWDHTETIRPDGFNATLTDVDASPAHGAWAAGFLQGTPGDQRPWVLKLHEDGHGGSRPPLAEDERVTLAGISVTDTGGIWVAGTAHTTTGMEPYVAVREGDAWNRLAIDGFEGAALADITVPAAGAGWAVGHQLDGAAIRALILHWDGAAWSPLAAPDTGDEPTLLTSVSWAEDVLAIGGTTWDPQKQRYAAFAARLVDGEWIVSDARRGWGMGTITDISGDPGTTGWAVGRADKGIVARVCDAPPAALTGSDTAVDQAVGPPAPIEPPTPTPLSGRVIAADVTAAAGLPTESQSWGSTAADFDGDGLADLFVGRHGARARLYRNTGGTFVDTELKFGGGDRHACAVSDVDDSGWLDLYCTFGASRGTGTKNNQLWLDPGTGAPVLAARAGGASEPLGRGRQPRFFDIDEDGNDDLLIGQETKRMDGQPSLNRAYLRTGPGSFEATEIPGFDSGLATEAIDIADYDGDGLEDVLLIYWDKRAVAPTAGIRLYRNEPGTTFTDVTTQVSIKSIGERDALLVDLDGDERPDLVQLSPDRIVASLAQDGRFERAYERDVSDGTAVAAGDADGDGDVDLYVLQGKSDGGAHDIILRNEGNGRSFTIIDVPEVRGGSEDDVIALDYDADGRTDFLALNGRNSVRGPVQLITLVSAN